MEEGSQPEQGQYCEHTPSALGGSGALTGQAASLFSPGEIKREELGQCCYGQAGRTKQPHALSSHPPDVNLLSQPQGQHPPPPHHNHHEPSKNYAASCLLLKESALSQVKHLKNNLPHSVFSSFPDFRRIRRWIASQLCVSNVNYASTRNSSC